MTSSSQPQPEKSRSRFVLLSFLAVFVLIIGGSIALLPGRIAAAREKNTLLAAQALYVAIETAGANRTPSGIGYPAESGAKTTREYIAALEEKGYIKRGDFPLLSGLVLANTSEADPRNTVLFVDRAGFSRYGEGREKKLSHTYLMCLLDGTIEVVSIDTPPPALPERKPVFLEP